MKTKWIRSRYLTLSWLQKIIKPLGCHRNSLFTYRDNFLPSMDLEIHPLYFFERFLLSVFSSRRKGWSDQQRCWPVLKMIKESGTAIGISHRTRRALMWEPIQHPWAHNWPAEQLLSCAFQAWKVIFKKLVHW